MISARVSGNVAAFVTKRTSFPCHHTVFLREPRVSESNPQKSRIPTSRSATVQTRPARSPTFADFWRLGTLSCQVVSTRVVSKRLSVSCSVRMLSGGELDGEDETLCMWQKEVEAAGGNAARYDLAMSLSECLLSSCVLPRCVGTPVLHCCPPAALPDVLTGSQAATCFAVVLLSRCVSLYHLPVLPDLHYAHPSTTSQPQFPARISQLPNHVCVCGSEPEDVIFASFTTVCSPMSCPARLHSSTLSLSCLRL